MLTTDQKKEYELALELREAGFPLMTRWEVENNYRRTMSATGKETLPPIGALLSEIKNPALWKGELGGEEGWFADVDLDASISIEKYQDSEMNKKAGFAGKEFLTGYIDTYPSDFICFGQSPEIALSSLYIEIKKQYD